MAGKYLKPKKTVAEKKAEQQRTKQQKRDADKQSQQKSDSVTFASANSGYISAGSDAEQAYLQKLRQDMGKVDTDYVNYVKKQAPYRENKAEMQRKFSGMNNIFFNQMLLTCVSPLEDGVGVDSVVECMAMYMGMSLVNKDFRNRVKNMKIKLDYQKATQKANAGDPGADEAKERAAKLKRELTMYDNGGREPYTAHSAALTKIGMTERAYADMRQPGADIERIRTQYMEAIATLDEQCADDGISASDVNKKMRTLVGQYSDTNPKCADIYQQLSYEGVGKAPYHRNSNDPSQMIWTGEYVDFDGNMFSGAFTPREPLTVESAAKIKMDMTIQAYENMRKDGADVDAFLVQYDESMETLSRLCKVDGIDEHAVNQQMRLSIGERMRKNPAFGNIFRELSYDGVEKAPPHRNPNNPTQAVWTGEYMTRDGMSFDGQFTPRPPMSQEYAAKLKLDMIIDAHASMREPGVDADAVMRKFAGRMARFSKQCSADGINEHDVNQQIRIMIGEQCERTPEAAVMFDELSSGAVTRVASHMDATNPGQQVWTGEYKTSDGKSFNGAFTPRRPRDYESHMQDLERNAGKQFKQVKSVDELYGLLRSYVNANATVFGDMPVAQSDAERPQFQNVSMDMYRMRADCTFDSFELSDLTEQVNRMPDSVQKRQLESRIDTYNAVNDAFRQTFDGEFNSMLMSAYGRAPEAVRKDFAAVYGSPKDAMMTMQAANAQKVDIIGPPKQSQWQIYDFHANAMERAAVSEFSKIKTADDLHGVLTGYAASYASVCDGAKMSPAETRNLTYQRISQRMKFMIDDCGIESDATRDFESHFAGMIDAAQKKVPSMVLQEFMNQYGEPSDFVGKMRQTYQMRSDSQIFTLHPGRGRENDIPSSDLSAKGRGADAARRLGMDDADTGMSNSGKDYQA